MLEVRCGTADKSHENRFFRYFASQVKGYLEKIGIEGILIGMPECKVMGNLQMDALLITDSSLTIIDFKDYTDCEVQLPDEQDFERGRWTTNKEFYIKGGSSPNPYAQLMLQRSRLKEILDRFCRHKIADFDSGHISAMVCFTGSVSIDGGIPGWAKLKFFIADSESFLAHLFDIANVRATGLLESEFVTSKFDTLFEAHPYECEAKPNRPFVREEPVDPAANTVDENAEIIRRFFADNSDVLVVASIDPLERQRLALVAQQEAHAAGFDEAAILSPTKLAGDNLCSRLELDGSLYSEIYDFNSKAKDDEGVDHISLGRPQRGYSLRYEVESSENETTAADNARYERMAFVVCDSQLVSSNAWVNGSVVFGSGRLLADVLEYLSIDKWNNGKNKIVFIGDDCQLGAGSQNSSMRAEAYPEGVSVERTLLPMPNSVNGSTSFISNLALCIRQSDYSLLYADRLASNPRIAKGPEVRTLIEEAVRNWREHKIVAYENEKAKQLNLFIKRSILNNGEMPSINDVLLLNEQIEAVVCNSYGEGPSTRTIRNGEFVRVTHVGRAVMKIPVRDAQNGVRDDLTIVPVRFVPEGSCDECEAWLILEYLYAQKAELTTAQEIAIHIRLSEMEKEARSEIPFAPGNRWYDSMDEEGTYDVITLKSGETGYRQSANRARLTPQENEYRSEILRSLESPGSRYYLLANLMKARYGWAVTAHKAQSNSWKSVTIWADTGLGRNSEGYFRYIYTGATRASEQVSVARWLDVTPFGNAVFDEQPSNTRKKAKRTILFRASPSEPIARQISNYLDCADLANVVIDHASSSSWREAFTARRGNAEATVAFDYNKSREVYAPRLEKGDAGLFGENASALTSKDASGDNNSPMLGAYRYVQDISKGRTAIDIQKTSSYRDEIRVENEIGAFYATVHYNANKIASRIELQSGSSGAFDSFSELLIPPTRHLQG